MARQNDSNVRPPIRSRRRRWRRWNDQITIEASRRVQLRRFYATIFPLPLSRIGSMTADLRATLSDSTTKGGSGFRQHASGRMFRSWIKLKPLSIATSAVRHRCYCICLGYRSRRMRTGRPARPEATKSALSPLRSTSPDWVFATHRLGSGALPAAWNINYQVRRRRRRRTAPISGP